MPVLSDIVSSPDQLVGVKAVWGRSGETAVMCFGGRGDESNERQYFSQARRAAELAQSQPYLITIGGGQHVMDGLRGRVLEVVRVTGAYGKTATFVTGSILQAHLAQWPVAVVLGEVYAVEDEPRLVEDLGFSDRRILVNAFDGVVRDRERVPRLWAALAGRAVRRRWDVMPPPGFVDPGRVRRIGIYYPRVKGNEGRRVELKSLAIERNRRLSADAKAMNRERNGGVIVCEACGLTDGIAAMFDAHHPQPLAMGPRETTSDDLCILCPTCHRWAHQKADDSLSPLPISEVKKQRNVPPVHPPGSDLAISCKHVEERHVKIS